MQRNRSYIFIDESGDFGTKGLAGSSLFVVVVAIVFDNVVELEKCKATIQNLKSSLKLSDKFEFKFSKLNRRMRRRFFLELGVNQYDIYYSCENKNDFKGTSFDLYFQLYQDLMKKLSILNPPIHIEIDGILDRRKKKETISFLRRTLGKNKVKIAFVNSKNSPLIQLADMVAGHIRIYQESLDSNFIDLFKRNIK